MIGTSLTHYRITAKLGEGGMGEVYRATDTKLGREVAIKVLPATFSRDSQSLARFEREAKALAALNHPHIAGIYGFDADQGTRFIVLELVEGETLSERLRRGPLPLKEALTVARQMAEAIQEAHEKGIIHRDLKPGNVKITPNGRVKVLDFGLAKMGFPSPDLRPPSPHPMGRGQGEGNAADPEAPTMRDDSTRVGAVMGTPAYMSPEQARGQEVDKRTDIWAFGCCLYECLSGRKPFRGQTASDLMAEVLKSDPDWLQLPSETPREVVTLLRRCLEKEPSRRLSSIGDIAITLDESTRGLAASSSPQVPQPSATTQPSPSSSGASARRLWPALAGLAILIIGGGIYFWKRPGADRNSQVVSDMVRTNAVPLSSATSVQAPAANQKSIAVLPFANLSEDKDNAFFTDGIHEDILTTLALVRELHVVSRTSVAQYRATTKTMRQIAQELGVAYVLEGSVRRAGNKVRVTGKLIRADSDDQVWAKSYDRDLTDIFAIQSELAQEIVGALQAVLSPQEKSLIEHRRTTNLAAYDLYLKGRAGLKIIAPDVTRAQAEQALSEAVKLDPNFAAAWGFLAFAHVKAKFNEGDTSAERLAKAKTALETAVRLAPDDPVVVEMQGSYYYYGYRDYARAAEHYQRLLLIQPNSADAYAQIGFVQRRQGKWAEALANMRRAVELEPRHTDAIINCGESLLVTRHYDEAIAQYRRVAEVAGDVFFFKYYVNHTWIPFFARGSTREGDERIASLKPASEDDPKVLYERRAWARVRGDWAAAVKIDQKQPYLDPYDDPHWEQDFYMVWDLVGANDLPAARARAKKLVPEFKARLEQQPAAEELWSNLALLHALLGDKEEALRCARKAVELMPESADRKDGPIYSMVLGQVLAWTGDKDAALVELARLLRTPYGANVHTARIDPGWLPLRGDPRFEALLNDPKNNAPLP